MLQVLRMLGEEKLFSRPAQLTSSPVIVGVFVHSFAHSLFLHQVLRG